jgi:pimeloyl-ACP methyl ester carboxylesterase
VRTLGDTRIEERTIRLKAKTWCLGLVGVSVLGYLGLCGYLFAEQRHLVFKPSGIRLDDPPAGSDYRSLDATVPGLGILKDWWIPPASSAMPTIIFFHGNGSDRTDFMKQGAQFHRRGWGVLLASYRGYSGNPGEPTESGLMADARATIATVAPRVGPIILWGHSLGSGVAARMASEGRAAGLVLEAPYTSITDVAAEEYPYVPVRLLLRDRFDTRTLVKRIAVPVLIFHSVDDREVPFAMGRELADQLGERATFVKLSGMGHFPHNQDLSDTVVRWAQERRIGG